MSSAAVQSGGPAIAGRQYQQSPHSRDHQYYAQHQQQQPSPGIANPSSPSSSSRKPTRRGSGNNASSSAQHTPMTPQQSQFTHQSPSSGSHSSNVTTPRAIPLPPSTQTSPTSPPPDGMQPQSFTSGGGGPPIAPPPRTSSNAYNNITTTPTDTRSSHQRSASNYVPGSGGGDSSRRQQGSSSKNSPRQKRSGSAGRSRQSPGHSRSATAVDSPPVPSPALSREDNTILNRIVTSDPQEDIARERARQEEARPMPVGSDATPISPIGDEADDGRGGGTGGAQGGMSRQDHSRSGRSRKETRFGDYVLGQTLGEGEFGKVKMGWKKDGGIQVAIKLIRRESLGANPSRLPKIYREIAILRELQHPNIVRLHEMVERERHIGIILEYASGGELFDYILNHRYLKDSSARRLFAQLVSGVGYLHKKGIVHRDLKLENLMLDRNRNIIITDFGFANTFDPADELGEHIENNLTNKEFVKKMNLDQIKENGRRRGDLMQTSCGSPCYAAPELVVSDSPYTGRKVDVWSCGVILYAMLAGYLPFDDDPSNPEGDNINLLYKYIVSTPLTFPEYVTPHARDILRRILVPDPRKRADLFEVARHSWLSEYSHVVGFITSSTTTENDIVNTTVADENKEAPPSLARSASVREAGKIHTTVVSVGGLAQKHGNIDSEGERQKMPKDAKRRTVQVEYVAPPSQTQRGEMSPTTEASNAARPGSSRTRARQDQGPAEAPQSPGYVSHGASRSQQYQSPKSSGQTPSRPPRESGQKTSTAGDRNFITSQSTSNARPSTGGTLPGNARLPSRGSYGQPSAAAVAPTNAQGHFSQPKPYVISAPIPQQEGDRPHTGRPQTDWEYQAHVEAQPRQQRSHRRSNTVSGLADKLFGRTGSMFGSRQTNDPPQSRGRNAPPVSMAAPIPNDDSNTAAAAAPTVPRQSADSRRSFGFTRKSSDVRVNSGGNDGGRERERSSKRFSLLPASFSMRNFGGRRASNAADPASYSRRPSMSQGASQQDTRSRARSRPQPPTPSGGGMAFGQGRSRSPSQSTGSSIPAAYDSNIDRDSDMTPRASTSAAVPAPPASAPAQQTRFDSPRTSQQQQQQQNLPYQPPSSRGRVTTADSYGGYSPSQTAGNTDSYRSSDSNNNNYYYRRSQQQPPQQQQARPLYPAGFNSEDSRVGSAAGEKARPAVLQKPHRRFNDAYENESAHGGSSGAARRVMDLFRRRGRAREERRE